MPASPRSTSDVTVAAVFDARGSMAAKEEEATTVDSECQ